MVAQTADLPNVRRIFIPDPGYVLVEADQPRAEAQIVAAESGDKELRAIFQGGIDVHTENAVFVFGPQPSDKYTAWYRRDRLKRCIYAIQNGGSAKKCGELLKNDILGQKFYDYWTGRFPSIPKWHSKLEFDIKMRRCLENVWGFKLPWLDRTDGNILGEAVPWITQSTIGITLDHAYIAVDELGIEVLLQVHDSLLMQVRAAELDAALPAIQSAMSIPIPYDPPLVIVPGLAVSERSWGDVVPWEANANAKTG